tara:strand:+ start:4576 stop:4770 length:195 start_codon:yes stop_codon:yes gene_type:complete
MGKSTNRGLSGNNDQSESVGNFDNIPSSEWSVRAKSGITDEFEKSTWAIPNPTKKTRENKGPGL